MARIIKLVKNAVICNNKNRRKTNRMHRGVIDFINMSALVTFSCNDNERIKATKKSCGKLYSCNI